MGKIADLDSYRKMKKIIDAKTKEPMPAWYAEWKAKHPKVTYEAVIDMIKISDKYADNTKPPTTER